MSFKENLARAVEAWREGKSDDCLSFIAKAGEFGDDLTQFVDEILRPPPRATRNDTAVPSSENTLSPSLASASGFLTMANRLSRQIAVASYLEDDETEDYDVSDMELEATGHDIEDTHEGVDGIAEAKVTKELEYVCGPVRCKQ